VDDAGPLLEAQQLIEASGVRVWKIYAGTGTVGVEVAIGCSLLQPAAKSSPNARKYRFTERRKANL